MVGRNLILKHVYFQTFYTNCKAQVLSLSEIRVFKYITTRKQMIDIFIKGIRQFYYYFSKMINIKCIQFDF